MISIKINNLEFLVKPQLSILEACKFLGYTIPRFCYHESLSISGNCRMCLVEVEGFEKPVASCVTDVEEGMSIWLNTVFVKKARENILEILLINHPLDCPICDQAGECDLQDQTKLFGGDYTRFFNPKTTVEDKNCGPLIKTIMTRCIHCTRCIRFGDEIAGLSFLGTLNRGNSTEIGSYLPKVFESEISGNVIDLCPVGALTSKSYAFKSRPWELRLAENIDLTDGVGSNLYVNYKEIDILRITPKNNAFINESFISDKARFFFDFLKKNRILSLFEKQNSKFVLSDWVSFLGKIHDEKKVILINEELGGISISALRMLSFILGKQFKIKTTATNSYKNYFIQNSYDYISSIDNVDQNCYLLSSNLRLEACILNLRLRLKQKKSLLTVNGVGHFFESDIVSNFIYLDISNSLFLLEGKCSNRSNLLVKDKSPLFILGSNLNTRVSNDSFFIQLLKEFFGTCKIIKLSKFNNSEGINFFGLKKINTKSLNTTKSIVGVKLDDVVFTRKVFSHYKSKFNIWLNTHGSVLALKTDFILPVLSAFEEEELYLSLEQRPQTSARIFKALEQSRSISSIFSSITNIQIPKLPDSLDLDFLLEMSQNVELFEINKNKKFNTKYIKTFYFSSKPVFLINIYPLKFNSDDFYSTGVYTKNSAAMQECSKNLRKQHSIFSKI